MRACVARQHIRTRERMWAQAAKETRESLAIKSHIVRARDHGAPLAARCSISKAFYWFLSGVLMPAALGRW